MAASNDLIQLTAEVPPELSGLRLDQALAQLFPEHSRERLKSWIQSGECQVNQQSWRPKDKVAGGEQITIQAEQPVKTTWSAEAIQLQVIHEDADLIIVNKPMDFVVHPAAGHKTGTLVNALLHHFPELEQLPRAGIVHRLDKDTTGLLIVARNLKSHTALVKQLQKRQIHRIYHAVVQGIFTSGGTINQPIGRHPRDRLKMAIVKDGKEAITHFRVLKRFEQHTYLQVQLETGRTHQIRVHMASLKHPLVGDRLYGGRLRLPKNASESLQEFYKSFKRQALHAKSLSFEHPHTHEMVSFECDLPDDFKKLLSLLQ